MIQLCKRARGLHGPMSYQDAFVAINNAAGINSPSLYISRQPRTSAQYAL